MHSISASDQQDRFAQANALAANGQYIAASSLLDTLDNTTNPVAITILRGKIAAQRGEFEEAIHHWQSALNHQPNNQEAREGMELAMELKDNPARAFLFRANLHATVQYGLITFLLIILLIFALRDPQEHLIDTTAAIFSAHQEKTQAALTETKSEIRQELTTHLDELEARLLAEGQSATAQRQSAQVMLDRHTAQWETLSSNLLQQNQQLEQLFASLTSLLGQQTLLLESAISQEADEKTKTMQTLATLTQELANNQAEITQALTHQMNMLKTMTTQMSAEQQQIKTTVTQTQQVMSTELRQELDNHMNRLKSFTQQETEDKHMLRSMMQTLINNQVAIAKSLTAQANQIEQWQDRLSVSVTPTELGTFAPSSDLVTVKPESTANESDQQTGE